ncbi:MAG TPA: VanZ family protein [Phycisphaerae bacterium]|nr:VanZ family protein [Phycisphaerae bacterium]
MRSIRRRARTVIWALFLATAFVATHLPPPALRLPPDLSDKLLHVAGFSALGIMTIWRMGDVPRGITIRVLALSFVGLVAYGIFDEATQPYFGRTFDLLDWAADIGGAAVGTAIAAGCYRCLPRTEESSRLG